MKQILWKQTPHLLAGTTLRDPNMPENGNLALHTPGEEAAVLNNRKQFVKELGISLSDCVFLQQTHSDHFVEVTAQMAGKGALSYQDGIVDCDACYTREEGLLIGDMTAGCAPILLYDELQGIIAAIHAGWKGTLHQITAKLVKHLIEQEQVDPAYLHAYIGPSIAFSSLEVGSEVIEQIHKLPLASAPYIQELENGKALLDNVGLNKKMLLELGVLPHHITIDKNDTKCDNPNFFSYRRDHACGRHFTYIMKRPSKKPA